MALETSSKINLVDFAGSERNEHAKPTGKHLAEVNGINAPIPTLRRVLDGLIANGALAQNDGGGGSHSGGAEGARRLAKRRRVSSFSTVKVN